VNDWPSPVLLTQLLWRKPRKPSQYWILANYWAQYCYCVTDQPNCYWTVTVLTRTDSGRAQWRTLYWRTQTMTQLGPAGPGPGPSQASWTKLWQWRTGQLWWPNDPTRTDWPSWTTDDSPGPVTYWPSNCWTDPGNDGLANWWMTDPARTVVWPRTNWPSIDDPIVLLLLVDNWPRPRLLMTDDSDGLTAQLLLCWLTDPGQTRPDPMVKAQPGILLVAQWPRPNWPSGWPSGQLCCW